MSKNRTIATLEELKRLPDTSAYLMADGTVGRIRNWSARSHSIQYVEGSMGAINPENVPLPVTLIWKPTQ